MKICQMLDFQAPNLPTASLIFNADYLSSIMFVHTSLHPPTSFKSWPNVNVLYSCNHPRCTTVFASNRLSLLIVTAMYTDLQFEQECPFCGLSQSQDWCQQSGPQACLSSHCNAQARSPKSLSGLCSDLHIVTDSLERRTSFAKRCLANHLLSCWCSRFIIVRLSPYCDGRCNAIDSNMPGYMVV